MGIAGNLALSLAFERIKAQREAVKATAPDTDAAAAEIGAYRWCMQVLAEEANNAPPLYIGRPSKPVFPSPSIEPEDAA